MSASSTASAVDLDRDMLLSMYERMMQIRTFEELAGKNFAAGLVPGFVHLYAGEEAVAVGICSQLTDNDYITSTHRGHGHCIAKGVDIAGMVAELMGKSTGVCKGKGGSMHIADVEKGMLGANGIVGGGIPLACGAALTAKTLRHRRCRGLLLRRRRRQPGHVPRGAQPGRDLEPPGRLCLREQRLRRVDSRPLSLRGQRHCQPRRRLRDPRRRRRRARRLRRLRGGGRGDRAGAARRGSDAARDEDLSLLRPLPGRPGHLPHGGGAGTVQATRSHRRLANGDRRPRHRDRQTSSTPSTPASATNSTPPGTPPRPRRSQSQKRR